MRKIILYIAASLDNYIARPDGSIDWLTDPKYKIPNEDFGYQVMYNSIDTVLMGHETYKVVLDLQEEYMYNDRMSYVFSRSGEKKVNEQVQFVSGDIAGFVAKLKQQEGKDIWLIGGGQINALMLENKLIDQIVLTILPITLGDGIPLFQKHSITNFFQLEKANRFENGMVQLILNLSSVEV